MSNNINTSNDDDSGALSPAISYLLSSRRQPPSSAAFTVSEDISGDLEQRLIDELGCSPQCTYVNPSITPVTASELPRSETECLVIDKNDIRLACPFPTYVEQNLRGIEAVNFPEWENELRRQETWCLLIEGFGSKYTVLKRFVESRISPSSKVVEIDGFHPDNTQLKSSLLLYLKAINRPASTNLKRKGLTLSNLYSTLVADILNQPKRNLYIVIHSADHVNMEKVLPIMYKLLYDVNSQQSTGLLKLILTYDVVGLALINQPVVLASRIKTVTINTEMDFRHETVCNHIHRRPKPSSSDGLESGTTTVSIIGKLPRNVYVFELCETHTPSASANQSVSKRARPRTRKESVDEDNTESITQLINGMPLRQRLQAVDYFKSFLESEPENQKSVMSKFKASDAELQYFKECAEHKYIDKATGMPRASVKGIQEVVKRINTRD